MSKCCGNCFWSFTAEDEEQLEGYEEDDVNRPQAGDCCIGQDHGDNYCCEAHSYIKGMEEYENFVFYDEEYLGPGYFIVSKLDGEVVKFMKISSFDIGGLPSFSIRAYEKDSIDKPDEEFRTIRFNINKNEPLYDVVLSLSMDLNTKTIKSIDPDLQGQNHFYVDYDGIDNLSLCLVKDVYGVKHASDFVGIFVGDNNNCELYQEFLNFYNNLSTIAVDKTNDSGIKKLILGKDIL